MNSSPSFKLATCLFVSSIVFIRAFTQTPGKWDRDSIYHAITYVFPDATQIELTDSGEVVQLDSSLNGWWKKATISIPTDTSKVFLYFYHLTDTSVIHHVLDAAIYSSMNAASGKIQNPYCNSLPFTDVVYRIIFLYTMRLYSNKPDDYYVPFENRICTAFRVPSYKTSLSIKLVDVKQEQRNSPPPPPPPQKKKQKQ